MTTSKPPTVGWRGYPRYLLTTPTLGTYNSEQMCRLETSIVDITRICNVGLPERYRVNRLVDLVEPD